MVRACRKASKTLIRDFGEVEKLQVSVKGPGDFVSVTDKKVEKVLIEELQKARPDYSILSEEIGEIKNDKEFVSKREEILSMIWNMEEEIMGKEI